MKFMCVLPFSPGLEERVKNLRRYQVKITVAQMILFPTLVILFPRLVIFFPRHGNFITKVWDFFFGMKINFLGMKKKRAII